MTCQEQLFAIFEQVKLLTQRKDAAYAELKRGLETQGVEICSYSELEKRDVEFLDSYFEHEVRPLLSPQIKIFMQWLCWKRKTGTNWGSCLVIWM